MQLPSVFEQAACYTLLQRVGQLSANTQPTWGKMDVAQMLAHCNIAYELIFEDKHPKPGRFKMFLLRTLLKPIVTNTKPYKINSPTSPIFKVVSAKQFEQEKQKLIAYIKQVQQMGAAAFEGKAAHSFGPLNAMEWNNMMYKHLDHHLRQFGV